VLERVRQEAERVLSSHDQLLLAVSGGRDSMALLDVVVAVARERIAAVATFDHRSGPASAQGCTLVESTAAELGIPFVTATLSPSLASRSPSEALWREARWRFLEHVAAERGAAVVTAHTRDDQVETVLIRVLRHAGARGLAGLAARGRGVRPFLALSREMVARYAACRALRWCEDPSNRSLRYLRNRVRLELLPALERARPGLSDELIAIADRAAELPREVEAEARPCIVSAERTAGALRVSATALARYDARGLALLWPAVAAQAGATLDHRGTGRLVRLTLHGRIGARIQLSGGWEVRKQPDAFVFARA